MKTRAYRTKAVARLGAILIAVMMAASFTVVDATQVYGAVTGTQARTVSTTNTVHAGNNTVKLTGCVKGKEYVLSVVKGSYRSYEITDSSLLYVDQKTAEGTELTFTFPITGSARVVVLISSNDEAAQYPVVIGEANIPISEAAVSMTNRTYNGRVQQTAAAATYRGTRLGGADFAVSGRGTNVGTYNATITGRGRFIGSVTKRFNINPVGTSVKSVKRGKRCMTVKWAKPNKKYKKQMSGYQIQYGLNANFRGARIVSGGGYSKKSKKIKGLQSKKRYYVRIRTYKGGCYSSWSATKSVVVK